VAGPSLQPKIRVVVPTFRRPLLLHRLVEALEAQTLSRDDFEVVIVDNDSGDSTWPTLLELAERTAINLQPMTAKGDAAKARNAGWRSTTTPYLAFTDDDCFPEPKWLEAGLAALDADPSVGVLQGSTKRPPHIGPGSDWTWYREILGPTPWFEGCNLFCRTEAVAAAGGFDESMGWGAEDTMLGWGVLAGGWNRSFADEAVVWHDNQERGVGAHIRYAWKVEGRICTVARRFPALRQSLWRPWAVTPNNVAYGIAVIGGLLGLFWKRPFLLLLIPYARLRRPPIPHHRFFRLAAERFAVDTARFGAMTINAVKERQILL
jgi:glycosyltransferase involved in cell wall biosynthesis